MKILIITAHPSSRGFTHSIAQTFLENAKKAGHEVELENLYSSELKQDFVKFEDIRTWQDEEVRKEWQNKISAADEIVLIHPVWWFDMPAILKNWFDQNFTAGFAYKYQKGGKVDKLLTGKNVRIFATADGPKIFYAIFSIIFKAIWERGRFGFCGYKIKNFDILGAKRKRTEAELNKFLEKVARIARSS